MKVNGNKVTASKGTKIAYKVKKSGFRNLVGSFTTGSENTTVTAPSLNTFDSTYADENTLAYYTFENGLNSETPEYIDALATTSQISDRSFKFGSKSLYVPYNTSFVLKSDWGDLDFFSKDCTIDFWTRSDDNSAHNTNILVALHTSTTDLSNPVFKMTSSYANSYYLLPTSENNQLFNFGRLETDIPSTEWTHFALVFEKATKTVRLFINGKKSAEEVGVSTDGFGSIKAITTSCSYYYPFFIDCFRISNCVRYTEDFGVPTKSYIEDVTGAPEQPNTPEQPENPTEPGDTTYVYGSESDYFWLTEDNYEEANHVVDSVITGTWNTTYSNPTYSDKNGAIALLKTGGFATVYYENGISKLEIFGIRSGSWNLVFEGSNDDSNYTEISTYTNKSGAYDVVITPTTSYKYIKITNNATGSTFIQGFKLASNNAETNPQPTQYAPLWIRGSFTDWEISDDYKMSTTDGRYYTFNNLVIPVNSQFKIGDEGWVSSIGSYGTMTVEGDCVVPVINAAFSYNLSTPNRSMTIGTLTYDNYNNTLTLSNVQLGEIVDSFTEFYLRGSFNEWGYAEDKKLTTTDGNIYVINNVSLTGGTEFKIATSDWGASYGTYEIVNSSGTYYTSETNCIMGHDMTFASITLNRSEYTITFVEAETITEPENPGEEEPTSSLNPGTYTWSGASAVFSGTESTFEVPSVESANVKMVVNKNTATTQPAVVGELMRFYYGNTVEIPVSSTLDSIVINAYSASYAVYTIGKTNVSYETPYTYTPTPSDVSDGKVILSFNKSARFTYIKLTVAGESSDNNNETGDDTGDTSSAAYTFTIKESSGKYLYYADEDGYTRLTFTGYVKSLPTGATPDTVVTIYCDRKCTQVAFTASTLTKHAVLGWNESTSTYSVKNYENDSYPDQIGGNYTGSFSQQVTEMPQSAIDALQYDVNNSNQSGFIVAEVYDNKYSSIYSRCTDVCDGILNMSGFDVEPAYDDFGDLVSYKYIINENSFSAHHYKFGVEEVITGAGTYNLVLDKPLRFDRNMSIGNIALNTTEGKITITIQEKRTLTLDVTPSDASVLMECSAEGRSVTTKSMTVKADNTINYTVSKSGYETQTGSVTMYTSEGDKTISVVLQQSAENTSLYDKAFVEPLSQTNPTLLYSDGSRVYTNVFNIWEDSLGNRIYSVVGASEPGDITLFVYEQSTGDGGIAAGVYTFGEIYEKTVASDGAPVIRVNCQYDWLGFDYEFKLLGKTELGINVGENKLVRADYGAIMILVDNNLYQYMPYNVGATMHTVPVAENVTLDGNTIVDDEGTTYSLMEDYAYYNPIYFRGINE